MVNLAIMVWRSLIEMKSITIAYFCMSRCCRDVQVGGGQPRHCWTNRPLWDVQNVQQRKLQHVWVSAYVTPVHSVFKVYVHCKHYTLIDIYKLLLIFNYCNFDISIVFRGHIVIFSLVGKPFPYRKLLFCFIIIEILLRNVDIFRCASWCIRV